MSDFVDVENAIENLKIGTIQGDINIILFGATGVGKSTFINALANYLSYTTFENALTKEIVVLVPFVFTIDFVDGKTQKIATGFHEKAEYCHTESSKTQEIRTYVFPIEHNQRKIHIIDTPGLSGTDKDKIILENILYYISNLHKLHALCFLFDQSKLEKINHFIYYIEHFFPQLDKCATENVVFIFTKTNDVDFDVKYGLDSLRVTVQEIRKKKGIEIPLDKNIFYFENENLQYLIAYKNGIQNMVLKKHKALQSWMDSTLQCWRLIRYIRGGDRDQPVKPYHVKKSEPICRIKRTVEQLIEPIIDVLLLLRYNVDVLQNHKKKLDIQQCQLDELKKHLYIPVISLEMIKCKHPITICIGCAQVAKVANIQEWHYPEACHKPCYLTNIREAFVDDDKLKHCSAMDKSKKCIKCTCDYSKHKHLYYKIKLKQDRIEDSSAMENIDNADIVRKITERLINKMEIRKYDLDNEYISILRSCSVISNFLKINALSPFKDPFEAHLKYLISRENSLEESLCDKETLERLERLLKQYEDAKWDYNRILENSKSIEGRNYDNTKDTLDILKKLYSLTHTGEKIKELYDGQNNSYSNEHLSTEHIIKHITRDEKRQDSRNTTHNFEKQQNKEYGNYNKENSTHSTQSDRKVSSNNKFHQSRWNRTERPKRDNRDSPHTQGASSTFNVNNGSKPRNTNAGQNNGRSRSNYGYYRFSSRESSSSRTGNNRERGDSPHTQGASSTFNVNNGSKPSNTDAGQNNAQSRSYYGYSKRFAHRRNSYESTSRESSSSRRGNNRGRGGNFRRFNQRTPTSEKTDNKVESNSDSESSSIDTSEPSD